MHNIRVNPLLLKEMWSSRWVAHPHAPARDYGVFHSRKTFSLEHVPGKFVIHVSADNRYQLFVNGYRVCLGSARGDFFRWYFESVDIGPYLKRGRNIVAAVVWNFGAEMPQAQISYRTRFLLQGDTTREQFLDTRADGGWQVLHSRAYSPILEDLKGQVMESAVGPGERFEAAHYPWGWEVGADGIAGWEPVTELLSRPMPQDGRSYGAVAFLAPRPIPPMEMKRESFARIVRGPASIPFTVPPGSRVSVLLDHGAMTTAYPDLTVSGGAGATVKICYAESLWGKDGKGNRSETEGKEIRGYCDQVHPDGGPRRTFRPLWWRSFRYVQLDIHTGKDPLVVDDFHSFFTAYPFKERGGIESDDAVLKSIWQAGWRTARLCAHETYLDCPYYEQLQYIGDTRLQALVSLAVSGDDRLVRNALVQFHDSRVPDGLLQSQHPTHYLQIIPPFALIWIMMVHDFWRYRDDPVFVKQFLGGIDDILGWFVQRRDRKKGLFGPLGWWNFVDWSAEFTDGVPDGGNEGRSSIIALLFVLALMNAAELHQALGDPAAARRYRCLAREVRSEVRQSCWDVRRNLFADTPRKKSHSQHVNLLAVLTDTVPAARQRPLMERILADESLIQCTYSFRFYLHQAAAKVGLGDRYISLLGPWRTMLKLGLTTWAERPEPSRSDCHAWSSHPNYDLLTIVCGIQPAEPGFRSVLIRPHLGPLARIKGALPHPRGLISVAYERKDRQGIHAQITLPAGLTGTFVWGKRRVPLAAGKNTVEV